MRIAPRIELDAAVQRELTALARRGRVEARVQQRAKIVLLAAQGWQNKDIAAEVELDRRQVCLVAPALPGRRGAGPDARCAAPWAYPQRDHRRV